MFVLKGTDNRVTHTSDGADPEKHFFGHSNRGGGWGYNGDQRKGGGWRGNGNMKGYAAQKRDSNWKCKWIFEVDWYHPWGPRWRPKDKNVRKYVMGRRSKPHW